MNKLHGIIPICTFAAILAFFATAEINAEKKAKAAAQQLKLESLMKAKLEGVKGTEVVVSRVTMPPNTTLPKHWHPGEEFGYVLSGEITLMLEGKEDQVGKEGEALLVPLKKVHSAKTGDKAATILVFRVHEQGKPERYKVE